MGPTTSDIADRLVALEPYASTEELDRFGPALQGIPETVMDDFTEMAKVPVGRELIEAVSEDPEGDRVRLEPRSSGAGPSTISPDGDATRMYDSVDGQCLPISDTPLPSGDAFLRYNPGETRQGGEHRKTLYALPGMDPVALRERTMIALPLGRMTASVMLSPIGGNSWELKPIWIS